MFDLIAGRDPDGEPGMASSHPAPSADAVEEPTPYFYPGGDAPPMPVTDYIAWIAENDAHEQAWADRERAARAQEKPEPGSKA